MENSHRFFLQSIMSHGVMSGKEVKDIYKEACQRFGDPPEDTSLATFVNTINANIRPLHLEIRKGVNEESSQHVYCLVNIVSSEITKLSTEFTVAELELFKKLIEHIVESEEGSMSSTDAINLADNPDVRLTKQDVQNLLVRFEQGKWLSVSESGEVSLSTRSILELDQYIQDQYPDQAIKCNMCSRLVLKGQSCRNCDVKLHLHCAKRYFGKSATLKCPGANCGAEWPHALPTQQSQDVPATQEPAQASQVEPSQARRDRRKTRR